MRIDGDKIKMQLLRLLSLACLLSLLTACVGVKLNNSQRLIEEHAKGFADAVTASPESRLFVEQALLTINKLEERIEGRE